MNLFSKLITEAKAGVLAGVMLSIVPVVADAGFIQFNDLTDSVFITTDMQPRLQGGCLGEVCTLRVLRPVDPLGGTLNSFGWFDLNIFETSGTLSDTILT